MNICRRPFLLFLFVALIGLIACNQQVPKSDAIQLKTFNYPVLKGNANNLVLRIAIENSENLETVKSIAINLQETNPKDIRALRLYFTAQDSLFFKEVEFGKSMHPKMKIVLNGFQKLKSGLNYFWVAYELSENADIDSWVSATVDFIQFETQKLAPANKSSENKLRTGIALRNHMDDDVHTYRIPGLTTTNEGTLLGIYDVRRNSGRDLQGDMDIGVSRSTDGGETWESMQIALDMKEWGGLPQKFNGVSDANILVDKNSNTIYIAGLWMHGVINPDGIWEEGLDEVSRLWNHQWRNKGSQPGLGVKQTSQFLLTKSMDDGKTWGEPMNLTEMCKDPKWWLWAPAPGHGITLTDGTLIFPTQGRDENGLPFSNITFSKDGGTTWETSKPAFNNTTECMAIELQDGTVMLNARDNRNRDEKGDENGRAIATTTNLGETWSEHETSHGALVDCVCMGSLHRHFYSDKNGDKTSVLLFSNPNSKFQRHKITIKVSFDDGLTWPENYWIELDEGRSAGYSCLTSIDENTIGILYEGSQAQMTFQRIPLQEIINGN